MADEVVASGKSIYEVAHEMALQILLSVENKSLKNLSRAEYLKAHLDCLRTLQGATVA